MGTSSTRAATLWLVGAAVVGGFAALLHVMRSDLGGAHSSLGLAVSAYALTAIAALMIYRGIVVAAGAQDAAEPPRASLPSWWEQEPPGYDPAHGQWSEPSESFEPAGYDPYRQFPPAPGGWQDANPAYGPVDDVPEEDDVYTFRRGRRIEGR